MWYIYMCKKVGDGKENKTAELKRREGEKMEKDRQISKQNN